MTINLPSSLETVKITALPNSAYYISDFISEAEEEYLIHKITSQPLSNWRTLSHRRLQVYPSALSPSGALIRGPLPPWLEEPLISRLLSLDLNPNNETPAHKQNLFSTSPHARPNHILINEYPPGTGIAPHEDGPAYHPLVVTISLAGHTVLDIYAKDATGRRAEGPTWRILQERRSLLVTMEEVYTGTLHGIGDVDIDRCLHGDEGGVVNWGLLREETRRLCEMEGGCLRRTMRLSATIRDVVNVRDLGRLLPGLGGRKG